MVILLREVRAATTSRTQTITETLTTGDLSVVEDTNMLMVKLEVYYYVCHEATREV